MVWFLWHSSRSGMQYGRFNPHSAPPPERRFSPTGSFTYRPRDSVIALVSRSAPQPPGKRLSAIGRVQPCECFLLHGKVGLDVAVSGGGALVAEPKCDHVERHA